MVAFSHEVVNDAVVIDAIHRPKWEFWVLLISDVHWDNPKCNRLVLKRHLDKAKDRGAAILDGGDFFCAMQGRGDRRGNKSDLRHEHQSGNYLHSLVRTAADYLAPYAENLVAFGRGNHEGSVYHNQEFDLTDALCERLRDKHGSKVVARPISDWIKFRFRHKSGGEMCSFVMWRHHGYGGGGPVTKDVIQANRQGVYLGGIVDLVWTGHTHDSWVMPQQYVCLSDTHRTSRRLRWHLKTPSYKDEFMQGGWADSKGMPPKPIGCMWLHFTRPHHYRGRSQRVTVQPLPELVDTAGIEF